jgi:hypothetical protein
VSDARIKGFAEYVEEFFRILENAVARVNFSPSRIYNVQEMGSA